LAATKQNQNAAKAIEAQKRIEAELGLEAKTDKSLTFRIAATEFLQWCHGTSYREHPNSAKRISGSFSSLIEFFGDSLVSDIEAINIERYKTYRATEHHVKDCTIRNDLNALSLFLQYAAKAKWRSGNPLLAKERHERVERPSNEDAIRMHVLTIEEEEAYFSAVQRNRNFRNVGDLGKLILLQGPRPEEILARRKRESVTEGSEWLFPFRHRKGYHIVQLDHTHDSVCQDAGVSFVLYDFRHTFATRQLIEAKTDMATLAAIMGHSSLRVLEKYLHPTAEHQRQATKQYEATRPRPQLRKIKA
jgi:integrase